MLGHLVRQTGRSVAAAMLVACAACKSAEHGVPLATFQSSDGRYFPEFVNKFFSKAERFAEDYPSVEQARSGVKLIEIKQLNKDLTRHNEANLSWSADGVYLGFEVIVGGFRKIMLKDLVGNYVRELKMIPKGSSDFLDGMVDRAAHSYNAGLRWSRDSTRFAFMSNGGVGEYNIYVGAIGSKEKPVAKSRTKDGYATWSPSTNDIAFVSGRSGNGDIYLVDLDNRRVRRLSTSNAVDIFPEWFPRGRRIVFSSGDAMNHDLYYVERGRSGMWREPQPLTKWRHDDLRPTVSPDGRYIAFYSSSGERARGGVRSWNILVIPYRKGRAYHDFELKSRVIARDVVIDLNTGPAWSPDSRKIFFVKRDPRRFNPIHAYDLFTGRSYFLKTATRMNRDILMSKIGLLSFRAQVGVWDKVFVALTNQGLQLQNRKYMRSKIHYLR